MDHSTISIFYQASQGYPKLGILQRHKGNILLFVVPLMQIIINTAKISTTTSSPLK